ncbi:MAG: hypothetical protein JRE16_09000 [Deltaproteobacteria bacterium]|jgi:hypothetical protein|nr:hypothetical protein [Deltaproteobacteria bacterium]
MPLCLHARWVGSQATGQLHALIAGQRLVVPQSEVMRLPGHVLGDRSSGPEHDKQIPGAVLAEDKAQVSSITIELDR